METKEIVYLGTAGMLTLSLAIIFIVLWAARSINRFKKFAQDRDVHYMTRLDGLEAIMRTEFKSMLEILKQ
jgi:hypothetical protein